MRGPGSQCPDLCSKWLHVPTFCECAGPSTPGVRGWGLDGALSYRRLAIRLQVFPRSSAPQLLRGRSSFLFEKVISVQLSRRHVFLGLGGTLTTGVAARAWLGGGSGSGRSPSRGRGKWTTFGSVALLGWNRQRHDTMSAAIRHGGGHQGGIKRTTAGEPARGLDRDRAGRGRGAQRPRPTDAVLTGAVPAAGGCRRSDRDGVRHRAATGALPAGSTLTTWVSFLAPKGADDLAVEFADPDAADVLALRLGRPSSRGWAS